MLSSKIGRRKVVETKATTLILNRAENLYNLLVNKELVQTFVLFLFSSWL